MKSRRTEIMGDEISPPWVTFPLSTPLWAGWRQGISEGWLHSTWLPFWWSLSAAESAAYLERWPPPDDQWRERMLEWAQQRPQPDQTAVRTALWRAMHVQVDSPPHVFEDDIGLRLAAPGEGWRLRPDMDAHATRLFRASIVARARFVEDLVMDLAGRGVCQYVILGAGLDTFAQRRQELASRLHVFEVDQPGAQAWKRRRLAEIGFAIPEWLRFVPADLEAGGVVWRRLASAGFDPSKPAIVACSGVSMYLTKDAVAATLRHAGALAAGSRLVMTFLVPPELADSQIRPELEAAAGGARASGTPFISYFTPAEITSLARGAGFSEIELVSAAMLTGRYFADRSDGLRPPDNAEELLVAGWDPGHDARRLAEPRL
jgi:methyltransferase (TIGR00027 family)